MTEPLTIAKVRLSLLRDMFAKAALRMATRDTIMVEFLDADGGGRFCVLRARDLQDGRALVASLPVDGELLAQHGTFDDPLEAYQFTDRVLRGLEWKLTHGKIELRTKPN